MSQNDQILKLFPQPVFKYKVDNFDKINIELLELFIKNLKKINQVKNCNVNGWHSKSFDLADQQGVPNKFLNYINAYIKNVFKNYGWIYNPEKVKYSSMWSIINKKGNFNVEHSHSNNYLSAAYYVKAPKNCGNFKASNPNIINRNFFPKSEQANELNAKMATIKVEEGDY